MSITFHQVEPLLLDRLRSELPSAVKILSAAELDGINTQGQPTPAVYVVPDGLDLVEDQGVITLTENWLTVVTVRNVRSQISGWDARMDAGPLLGQVFAALSGWQPEMDGRRLDPMRARTPPRPGFAQGYGYHPLAWQITLPPAIAPCPVY